MHRRAFLSWLAASPALRSADLAEAPIADPAAAINVLDFEAAARKALPPAHYGYLATGVDDDATLRANVEGFRKIYLRPRRLTDISKASTEVELFGAKWKSPIGLAPVGNQMAFHAEGELPVARAAHAKGSLQVLSTMANTSYAKIAEALGRAPWFQLYALSPWKVTEEVVRHVESLGCPVIALTVDTQAGRHTETLDRYRRIDKRECPVCHGTRTQDFFRRKPLFQSYDLGTIARFGALNWSHIAQIKKLMTGRLLVKGIETAEDARLCVENGADGIIVSNHGGRAEESGRGTIECLPEVIEAAGRLPVFLDGGIRRGTDVVKALALGAKAVFIGRPYIWGLSAFGQAGVERVIDILNIEFELALRQCGLQSVAQINRKIVGFR